jgi:hypothetical protein
MLIINKNQATNIICTLSEKEVSGTYWLFVFSSRTTNDVVNWIVAKSADLSSYTTRYNKFSVPASVFQGRTSGMYGYKVYEQSSATNTDVTGLNMVEEGFVKLIGSVTSNEIYTDGNVPFSVYQS